MTVGRRFLIAALAALVVSILATMTLAASRGISVQLRGGEGKDAPVTETVDLYGASYALIIGNDSYTGGWPRLSNAVKDARLVAAELESRGFNVILRIDLKSAELKLVFEEFFIIQGADPQARLFVWYAGHGHTLDGEGFLVPTDAPRPESGTEFLLKSLSMRRFGEFVRLAKAKHAFAVFDSCFAGTVFNTQRALPPAAITRATVFPVRQFLTSGDADQTVSDDGSFRELFLRALRGEERADANGDGYVTASEMGLFLSDRVTNLTDASQTPRYGKLRDKDYDRGDFVFLLPTAPVTITAKTVAVAPGGPVDPKAMELAFWTAIQGSGQAEDFAEFLERFPTGTFAGLARRRLDALATGAGKVAAVTPSPLAPPETRPPDPGAGAMRVFAGPYLAGTTFRDCPACPEMVVTPPGEFKMGSAAGFGDEEPAFKVAIPAPFAIAVHEVTFANWAACLSDGGCGGHQPGDAGWGGGARPVINVSWSDARGYARWLSQKTDQFYRLPSESEWEYAARAGTASAYWWGDSAGRRNANCNGCGSRWDNAETAPVGAFKANPFGLHDMLGNLWEWTEDCWHDDYRGAPADGGPWTRGGECALRVIRGGAWSTGPSALRAANRGKTIAHIRNEKVGFRVVRTLED